MLIKLPPLLRRRRTRRALRALGAAAIGTGLGLSCFVLPHEYQALCHAAAKVIGVLLGGH